MSGSQGSGHATSTLAILLTLAWGLFAWLQPVGQVAATLEREYGNSPQFIQRLAELTRTPVHALDDHNGGRTAQALGAATEQLEEREALYVNLIGLRCALFAAVYVGGLPLLLAAWQIGKAHQRSFFRQGIAPSPNWQAAGWFMATSGLIVPSLGPAPYVGAAALSFGWLGAGGAAASAVGSYLLGRHSRSG